MSCVWYALLNYWSLEIQDFGKDVEIFARVISKFMELLVVISHRQHWLPNFSLFAKIIPIPIFEGRANSGQPVTFFKCFSVPSMFELAPKSRLLLSPRR
jgi:hypothetical protein